MEEKEKEAIFREILKQEEVKKDCKLELRGMELIAYSSVMDAFRAEGTLDKEKKGMMESLKKHFNISESRHISEMRRVNSTEKLSKIAECLKEDGKREKDDTWETEAYDTFPSLAPFHRRVGGARREPFKREFEEMPRLGVLNSNCYLTRAGTSSKDPTIQEETKLAKYEWNNRAKKVSKKVQTKVTSVKNNKNIKVEVESESEEYSDEDGDSKRDHRHSPDIIDAASPPKNNKPTTRGKVVTRTTRGPKRRLSMERSNGPSSSSNKYTPSSLKVGKKMNKSGKAKGPFPKIKFVKKSRPPSPSSEDETKNITQTIPSLRTPNIRTTSCIRGTRGMRGSGSTRGRGRGGRIITPSIKANLNADEESQSPTRSAESLLPLKRSQSSSPNKTLKVLKPKKPKPVSISRRKSRLKEKEDDEMQMEWNDYDDDCVIMSNKQIPIKKRRLLSTDTSQSKLEMEKPEGPHNNLKHEHLLENGESHKDIVVRHHHHLQNQHHQYLSPDSCYNRVDVPHKSPQLSGEETDSASEKGSITGSRTNESPSNTSNASSPPPLRQKQRLKTPLASITSQLPLPRITIPPPVFSTSLTSLQKKRTQKQISVVDSLNLHLPTTATASSLASSARRPPLGVGNSVFSNSAMLANARGGPGILNNQRKASPHILSNHRTFVQKPNFVPASVNNAINPTICVSVGGVGGTTINLSSNPINSIVSNTSTILSSTGVHQVQTSIIPTMSSSTSPTVMQIPSTMSAAIPMSCAMSGPRAPGPGGPIIFLQKANNSPNVPTSTIGLTSNTLPVKSPSRAVILRRSNQPSPINRAGVMILDIQNKPLSNQMPQFLHPVSRIITTASSEVVLNIQGGGQNKILQAHSNQSSEPTVVYSSLPAAGSQRKQKFGVNQDIHPSVTSYSSEMTNNALIECEEIEQTETIHLDGQNDNEMAQIEAELLEMEQEIVYEEEVVTSSGPDAVENNSFQNETIYASNFPPRHNTIEVSLTQQPEIRQMSNALTRAIVSNSTSPAKETNDCTSFDSNAQNHVADDIFQTALKSSGIVFADQQFYDVEEMCANSDNQSMPVTVANHITIESQENGGNLE